MDIKTCTTCRTSKPLAEFRTVRVQANGKLIRTNACKLCINRRDHKAKKRNPEREAERARRNTQRLSDARKAGENTPYFIWVDCGKSDRKKGRRFDLTAEQVSEIIRPGCFYCEESNLRMTLDRIDNDLGHTAENVNACCIRCNYMRSDMPYRAWMLLVPAVRQARTLGLFADWRSKSLRRAVKNAKPPASSLGARAETIRCESWGVPDAGEM